MVPVALGARLPLVERIIKRDDYVPPSTLSNPALYLKGMECRWDSIRPPDNTQEVVCLLVVAQEDQSQPAIFSNVLAQFDLIYGPLATRSPVSLSRLKLKATLGKINTEMRAKLGRFDISYLLENWLCTLIGGLYFRLNSEGAQYLRNLVKWSNTLMIDSRINTIMCGTAAQRHALIETQQRLEDRGDIRFGLHVSQARVISCYVRDRRNQHITSSTVLAAATHRPPACSRPRWPDRRGFARDDRPLLTDNPRYAVHRTQARR